MAKKTKKSRVPYTIHEEDGTRFHSQTLTYPNLFSAVTAARRCAMIYNRRLYVHNARGKRVEGYESFGNVVSSDRS